jgi:hypothetical protein
MVEGVCESPHARREKKKFAKNFREVRKESSRPIDGDLSTDVAERLVFFDLLKRTG